MAGNEKEVEELWVGELEVEELGVGELEVEELEAEELEAGELQGGELEVEELWVGELEGADVFVDLLFDARVRRSLCGMERTNTSTSMSTYMFSRLPVEWSFCRCGWSGEAATTRELRRSHNTRAETPLQFGKDWAKHIRIGPVVHNLST